MLQTSVSVTLIALNSDMLTSLNVSEIAFIVWLLVTGLATYIMYFKASFTDPGTIKTQIYLNQNTEESANHIAKSKKHARKPSTMLQELEREDPESVRKPKPISDFSPAKVRA